MPVFIFWIAYLFSPNTGKYMCFLKIPIFPAFFGVVYVTSSLHPTVFLALTNSTPIFVCLDLLFLSTSTSPSSYLINHSYPALPIFPLKMTLNPLNRRRKYICSTSSREFEECPNRVRYHTWRKRSQNEKRKPMQWNGIRLLLFDKCKFTKSLNWKTYWTRQTTHWSHIYQIWNQNLALAMCA